MKGYKQIKRSLGNIHIVVYLVMFIGAFVAVGSMVMSGGGNVEAADASDHILVSNMDHGGTLLSTQTAYDYAQAFQTGTNPNGYTLDNLQIAFTHATSTESRNIMNPRIELYRVDSSGHWQPMAAWLDPDRGTPNTGGEFIYTYNTPPGMDKLELHTKYYITVARSASMSLSLTSYTNHDATSARGWWMPGGVWIRGNSFDYSDAEDNDRMRLRLNGDSPAYIDFTGASYPPHLRDYGGIRPLCEQLGNGYFTCEEDANGDIVTYIPEHLPIGIFAHWYLLIAEENRGEVRHWIEGDIDPVSGLPAVSPYSLRPGEDQKLVTVVTFDYEVKNRYNMVLKLHDVAADITTSYDFVIHIKDMPDHPGQVSRGPIEQTKKNAAGTAGKRDVDMCWLTPWNAGRPTITGHDVRYRIVADPPLDWTLIDDVGGFCFDADGNFVDMNHSGVDRVVTRGYTLTDLEPNTDYEFDVRAYNAQLTGGWAEHQRIFNTGGSTAMRTAPPTPEPPPAPPPAPTPTPLTAEFQSVPASHNVSDAFTLELRFSEHIPDLGYRAVRDHVLQLTNGGVAKAQRMTKGSNQAWRITVRPTASETVTVQLLATTDCDASGAICVGDRKLTSNIAAIIEAQ